MPQAQYQILSATSANALQLEVCELLRKGWVPQGGLAVAPVPGASSRLYYQAMTKPAQA